MVLKLAQLVSIVLSALVAGVFWGAVGGLTRSIATFPPESFLAIGHRLNRNLGPLMTVLMPVALLSIVAVLVLSHDRPATFWPSLAGFVLFVVALLVTVIVEVPIATRIASWTPATLPDDWQRQRDRWASVHVVRVVAGVAGLALLAGGAIF